MSDDQHYDVIVIGTGAGGGTFAHRIAPSGKRVLLLERGDYLPRERDNWDSTAVFVKGTYRAPEFWLDRHGHEFPPEVNYYVGGNTKFYGAALFRLRPQDFGELRHHGGISPAWPIEYADLEPYYTQAEHLYVVHGRHGEDPTAGHASADYRYPPVQHEPRIQQLSDDLEKQGLHPFHLPIGVRLTQDAHGMATRDSVCIRCDRVDGFPCLLGGKADAQVICVDPALEHDNVRLVTRAHVTRLETDEGGRAVTAVVTEIGDPDGGVETVRFSADVVVVAAGAVNSAALLLRSANDRHPDGLANGSGVVGRHYMRHNNLALMAVSKEPNPTRFQKTLAVNDWYLGSDDWDYPMGGIQMLGKSDAEQIRANAPHWAGAVSPGMPFEVLAHHAVDLLALRRGPSAAGEPGHPRERRPDPPDPRREEQRRGAQAPAARAAAPARRPRHAREAPAEPQHLHAQGHADRRDRAPGRHDPVRHRPGELRARRELPGARGGQPLRRRHQLLPEHRRGEPVADGHRQRVARRGSRARTTRLSTPDDRTGRTGERAMDVDRVDALVIFGATGDLAKLETFPALVGLVERGVLNVPIVGVAKSGWNLDRFRDYAAQSLRLNGMDPDAAPARRMLGLLRYVDGDLDDPATYAAMSQEMGSGRRALFYLEVPPFLFGRIAEGISAAGRADGARVMVEKPFGNDLDGARALNATMLKYFPEDAIYRVDHWLGLDPLNDVLVARFANSMIEPLLDNRHVESVQITMAEAFDVADRGRFYDRTGAIRDVVQNHMLQVLATVLADPPYGGLDDSWLDAKARVVAALRPLTTADVVRGQYEGYRDVDGVDPDSTTESYVAVRLALDTWRWAGVPIVIRAGKTMPVTATEVNVRFRPVPFDVFGAGTTQISNSLRFRIWPETQIGITLIGKKPGAGREAQAQDLVFAEQSGSDMRPYDRLIGAALDGQRMLFARQDTVEAAWRVVDPVLGDAVPVHPYPRGSWGPKEADALLPDGDTWHDPAG